MTKVLWRGWAIQTESGELLRDFNGGIFTYEKRVTAAYCGRSSCGEKPIRIAVVLDEKARKKP